MFMDNIPIGPEMFEKWSPLYGLKIWRAFFGVAIVAAFFGFCAIIFTIGRGGLRDAGLLPIPAAVPPKQTLAADPCAHVKGVHIDNISGTAAPNAGQAVQINEGCDLHFSRMDLQGFPQVMNVGQPSVPNAPSAQPDGIASVGSIGGIPNGDGTFLDYVLVTLNPKYHLSSVIFRVSISDYSSMRAIHDFKNIARGVSNGSKLEAKIDHPTGQYILAFVSPKQNSKFAIESEWHQ